MERIITCPATVLRREAPFRSSRLEPLNRAAEPQSPLVRAGSLERYAICGRQIINVGVKRHIINVGVKRQINIAVERGSVD